MIDLHYSYFMYFNFPLDHLSFTLSQPYFIYNPIPRDKTRKLSNK